ncbi:carbohydrate diacid regulon transcriptional regulator CdaR [Xanthomonas citri pv. citri]|nr:carbohydrate diacid regulon transcriptional regulator CdaR [Xanthomonas citri pv. citri]MBD3972977.1 carbohydrate diacid regulon transcriptional regulator CdaR [Xanthomonas citri pv. citri]MBD4000506.1 carbohydrate diacid regulon transcriptional regulator CdaR [Xanthomonas citri pv. citri]MBD4007437.1 carbohydrate diacid regulon transcriptional regulator CdaR [Xanthomonas citri pv. citri]MBD4015507.1 carbohydrate diacid regulon transcriptional regulator CdaR [Xanthomonas citri pv. citri]
MLTLDRTLAQSIVDRAMTIIDGNVNVMDHSGVIIASGEPARIGQLHEGALLVLSRQGRVEIDAALAQQLDAVRPGVNLPLIAEGRIVGCVGLTGDPQRIGQQAELVRMAAEAMLEQAGLLRLLARDARLREEVTLGLIRPDGPTPALAGWAERLGIALELPRVAAVIEVESDSLDLDAMLVELQRLHTLLSTPERGNLIAATALNELVVLKPALDRRGHWDVEEQRRRAHSLLERMRASSRLRIRLALGQYFPQSNGLALSHQIARTTMRIGKARTTMRIGKARTPHADAFFYDDYRLPVLVDDLRQAWQAEELRKPLQALLAQDRRSQLLKTLSVWFGAGMRMAPTAKALGIHRNTLDYRMQRIQELCAVDLGNTDDCMRLYLALQMRDDSAATVANTDAHAPDRATPHPP